MTPEHEHLERLAAAHDAKADDIFGDIARGAVSAHCRAYADLEATANRRAAEIIRYQIECES